MMYVRGGGSNANQFGSTLAALRAMTPTVGMHGIPTDAPDWTLTCSVAGTWTYYYRGRKCAPPSGAAWGNQGAATVTSTATAGEYIRSGGGAGEYASRVLTWTATGSDRWAEVAVEGQAGHNADAGWGAYFRESGAAKGYAYFIVQSGAGTTFAAYIARYSDAGAWGGALSSRAATYSAGNAHILQDCRFIQMRDPGSGDLEFYASLESRSTYSNWTNCILVGAETRAGAYAIPNQYGALCAKLGGGAPDYVRAHWWHAATGV